VKATAGGGSELKTEVRKRLFGLILLFSMVVLAAGAGMAGEPSRVVIVPFKINADTDLSFLKEGIVDMLTSRLSSGDRVVVIGRQETDQALHDVSIPVDEKAALAIGARLRADYVLFGSLTVFGNSISLDARMVDVHKKKPALTFFKQGKEIDEVIPQIDLLATRINETIFGRPVAARQPPAQAAEHRAVYAHPESLLAVESSDKAKVLSAKPAPAAAPALPASGGTAPAGIAPAAFWKSKNFKVAIKGLALGDVDGDGKTEVVFISNRRIYVYRFESQRLVKIWEKAGKRSERFTGVDVADINRNGRAEIFVTSLKGAGQRLDSFVLEWDGDGFTRLVKGAPWYYRVIESPEGGKTLLGQKRTMDDPFVPGVYQLTWRNGEYVPEERLTLPKGTNIFGFALGDVMNNGQQMIVAFDKGDHIRLFTASGEQQWKSDECYGGSMNYVESWLKGEDVPDRIYLSQRICVHDLDRDGRQELVVASNQGSLGRLFARLRRFENGRIACLSWTDLGLTQIGETRKVSGHISDCAIGDLDNDGTAEVVAVQVAKQGTAVTSARSAIIVYELAQ
jgi:TolB-like protein